MGFAKGSTHPTRWIKWIATHKAYDKIDVIEVRHGH
jgi:hypothetical protein